MVKNHLVDMKYKINLYYLLIPTSPFVLAFLYTQSLFVLAITVLTIMAVLIHYHFYSVELTEKSVIITQGIIFRKKEEILFSKINNFDLHENIFQRVLKTGTIQIRTGNNDSVFIDSLDNYSDLVDKIRAQLDKKA